jgi:RHS repeat-associated protein
VQNQGQAEEEATTGRDVTKYYYFNSQRVAMRGPDDAVTWIHGDHLGSTSLTTDESGEAVARQLYEPFGEVRWASGALGTDFGFTGQREDGYIGLVHMGARWYNPYLNRWIQPDTIVPDPRDPQALNRYAYSRNNPVRFNDPTGHFWCGVMGGPGGGMDCREWVYDALAVLDIYGAEEGKELYALFWELDERFRNEVAILFWMPTDKVAGAAPPIEQTIELVLEPDFLARDPMDPANWGMVATLAHELVHLRQDSWEKLSIQGEVKAYQMEGIIIDRLNKNRPPGTTALGKSRYTQEVKDLDLTTIEGVKEAHRRFGDIPGNIYTWQPVFPVDQMHLEKWWHQLKVTGTGFFGKLGEAIDSQRGYAPWFAPFPGTR